MSPFLVSSFPSDGKINFHIYSWCWNCRIDSGCWIEQRQCTYFRGWWIHHGRAGHSCGYSIASVNHFWLEASDNPADPFMSGFKGSTQSLADWTWFRRITDSKLHDVDAWLSGRLSRLVLGCKRLRLRERCGAVFWVSGYTFRKYIFFLKLKLHENY